jgi:hypothetical protein
MRMAGCPKVHLRGLTHEAIRVPELRTAALFREHALRELRAVARVLPDHETVTALKPHGNVWTALADPRGTYRFCTNAVHNVCNWLVSANSPEQFCAACRHNRVIPDLSQPEHLEHWRLIEIAKHSNAR